MSLKNPINAYICEECGVGLVTIDRDEGVTPFLLKCRAHGGEPTDETCPGMMRSCFYRPPRDAPEPTWEWYRPSEEEAKAAGPGMYQHHLKGGLFLRRIPAGAPPGQARIAWQCSSCHWGFTGAWQKVCPACGAEDWWTGSVHPDAKLWDGGATPGQGGRGCPNGCGPAPGACHPGACACEGACLDPACHAPAGRT